jgi:carbonic anhydrase
MVTVGDIFVHRNIGNGFQPDDINSNAVLEFAIQQLQVKDVIICGISWSFFIYLYRFDSGCLM